MTPKPPARCDTAALVGLVGHLTSPWLTRHCLPDIAHDLAAAANDAAAELAWYRAQDVRAVDLLPELEQIVGELAQQVRTLKANNDALRRDAGELRARLTRLIEGSAD